MSEITVGDRVDAQYGGKGEVVEVNGDEVLVDLEDDVAHLRTTKSGVVKIEDEKNEVVW